MPFKKLYALKDAREKRLIDETKQLEKEASEREREKISKRIMQK